MPHAAQQFADRNVDPNVQGFLHLPDTSNNDGFVLTHGAGSNAKAPLLVAVAEAFCAAGFTVLRCDLPFRQRRPFGGPGRADAVRDRAGLKNAIAALRQRVSGRIFLGGHSYGGRQASMLCSEEHDLVAGLVLQSYPLHPPGKPEQLRVEHLPNLRTPTLFVDGTRDPFGSIAELEQAIKLIPARTKLVVVEGAGHELAAKGKQESVAARVLSEFQAFM